MGIIACIAMRHDIIQGFDKENQREIKGARADEVTRMRDTDWV